MRHVSSDIREKSIFSLSPDELRQRLEATGDQVANKTLANGGYLIYHDDDICPDDDHAIREYSDRKELVKLDQNGKASLIKIL